MPQEASRGVVSSMYYGNNLPGIPGMAFRMSSTWPLTPERNSLNINNFGMRRKLGTMHLKNSYFASNY